ncbi:MAG: PD40 domain-containing protein [Planctomycetes bacterium]|nr:PD40 domain-containing protein [Planctomycetota bacterium]
MIASTSWDQLDAIGFDAIRIMLSILWQSSILLGAAALLVYALRRRSAALRHRVWASALLLTPLIPALTWLASQTGSPQLHIPIIPAYVTVSVEPTQLPLDLITSSKEQETDDLPVSSSAQNPIEAKSDALQTAAPTQLQNPQTYTLSEETRSAHPWAIAWSVYAGGLVILLGLVSLGRLRLRRYTRQGQIVTDPRITEVFEAARKQIGLKGGCVIVEIDNLHAPLTYLTFHPVIALPHGFTDELSAEELRTIALHELAHIKRHDPLVLNLASIIRAIFFFHPLVWLAAREIAALAEEAADNIVLEATNAPLPYAKMLTRLTEQLTHRMFQTELAVGIVFSKSALLRRIEAILSPRTDQLRHLSVGVIAMTTILVLGSLVLAASMPLTPASPKASFDDHASGMSVRHIWKVDDNANVYPSGVSRDGRYISFVDWTAGNLAIRDLKTGVNRLVTNNTSWATLSGWAEESVISPDGKQIAYHWFVEESGENIFTLRVSDIDGSNLRVLHQDKNAPWSRPFDWAPDGKNLLVYFTLEQFRISTDTPSKLAIVSVNDGSVTTLKEWKGARSPRMAGYSPDGKHVAFDFSPTETREPKDIFIIELKSGREIAVVQHPAHDEFLGWMPNGKGILFASDRTSVRSLWMIEVSNGRPVGSPVLLKSDFAGEPVGFAADGSYYFGKRTGSRNVFVATLDENDIDFQSTPLYASSRFVHSTSSSDWSPDGKSLAYKARSKDEAESSVFAIYSPETGAERIIEPSPRLRFGPAWNVGPVQWSPDGKALFVAGESLSGEHGIFRVDLTTSAAQLVIARNNVRNPLPTPDGKAVYFQQGRRSLVRRDLATGDETQIYQSKNNMQGLDLSPDGNWLAFHDQGKDSIFVISADGGEPREVVHLDKAEQTEYGRRFATWTPDGKHLLFSKRTREIWRVNVQTGEQQQIGPNIPGLRRATMHPDGKRIAFTTFQKNSELWVMENFLP